jgi:hypothetical protein
LLVGPPPWSVNAPQINILKTKILPVGALPIIEAKWKWMISLVLSRMLGDPTIIVLEVV